MIVTARLTWPMAQALPAASIAGFAAAKHCTGVEPCKSLKGSARGPVSPRLPRHPTVLASPTEVVGSNDEDGVLRHLLDRHAGFE